MKKLFLLLALILPLCLGVAYADDLDLSFVRENTDYYEMDVEIEDGTAFAFIESTLTASDLAFIHKYDSQTKYSYTQFDILVVDYLSATDAYPVNRLWIYYNADNNHQYINAVTFTIDGTKYTFSDVADAERYTQPDGVYRESLLIKFDYDNLEFLAALERLIPDDLNDLESVQIPMTLHGLEDLEVTLDQSFMLDFIIFRLALLNTNSFDYMGETNGTPMKMTEGLVQ